jgi:hypothetical protein
VAGGGGRPGARGVDPEPLWGGGPDADKFDRVLAVGMDSESRTQEDPRDGAGDETRGVVRGVV